MSEIKVFTWNMQRSPSLAGNPFATGKAAAAYWRQQVLRSLCLANDVGFITEPGKDIRDKVTVTNTITELADTGKFYRSDLQDNQSDSSACRPVLFIRSTRLTLSYGVSIHFTSGSEEAMRYPAAVTVRTQDGVNVLLVALHATSGFNAGENVNQYLDRCHEDDQSARAVIVGGDFNSSVPGTHMPATITHQSGHIIDGFFAQGLSPSVVCELSGPVETWVGNGYLMERGDGKGFMHRPVNADPLHLSDHCPVTAAFDVRRESEQEFLAKNPIYTGKRERKPNPRFGGGKVLPDRKHIYRDEPYRTRKT